jgi:multidrug efflux pump subunit AcrA (membrane-fusion protein)
MKKWTLLLLGLLLITGCGKAPATEPESEEAVPVAVRKAEDKVVAEAVIEPARWVELHFEVAGEVTEVLVSPGDQVAADAPLLRLEANELALSLRSAQQDVTAQKAALDGLIKGASDQVVARADKENADLVAQAEVALQVKGLQLDKAQAEDPSAGVTAAQARVEQLQLQLAQIQAEPVEADVAIAQRGVEVVQAQLEELLAGPDAQAVEIARLGWELAKNSLWQTQLERDAVAGRSGVPAYQKELASATVGAAEVSAAMAQLEYALAGKGATDEAIRVAQAAVRQAEAQRDRALGAQKVHAIGLDIVQAQIDEAEALLAQAIAAQEAYTITLEMLAAEVEAAQLELEALRTWDNPYLDEASDEEVTQAEAHLQQAELAVAQLELQLQDAELRAPFAGTAVDVGVEAGDQVNPGEVVVVLATLDQLQTRTTDLTELDVGRVTVEQPATVSVDALPGREFAGLVREIALQGQDYRGDVVYAVTVELTDPDVAEALRWGMTAMVEIETD